MLIVLRGPPCSGKSIVTKQVNAIVPVPVISSDEIRREMLGTCNVPPSAYNRDVWHEAHRRLENFCRVRANVIFDATNLRLKNLRTLTDIADKWGQPYRILSINEEPDIIHDRMEERREEYEVHDMQYPGAVMSASVLDTLIERHRGAMESVQKHYGDRHVEFPVGVAKSSAWLKIMKMLVQKNKMDMRQGNVWIFGDLHGKRALLQKALKALPLDARLLSVGDLIDRGEDSMGCLFELDGDPRFLGFTMGNHEYKFLVEHQDGVPCRSEARRRTHEEFARLSTADQKRALGFLRERSYSWILGELDYDGGQVLVTHAGVSEFDEICTNCFSTIGDMVHPVKEFKSWGGSMQDEDVYQVHGHSSWQYTGATDGPVVNIDSCAYQTGILRFFNPVTREVIDVQE